MAICAHDGDFKVLARAAPDSAETMQVISCIIGSDKFPLEQVKVKA